MAGGQEAEGVCGFSDTALLLDFEEGESDFDVGVSELDYQERQLPPQVPVREVFNFWNLCSLVSGQ